jgi:hypothetical protein
MAQTKAKPKSKAKKTAPKRAKPKSSGPKRSSSKARANLKTRAKPSRPAAGKAASSNGTARNGRATLPLVAGGAALVGAAGGVALGAAKSGSKVLGVRLPHPKRVQIRSKDLSKAAKRVGSFGDQVGDLTAELRSLRKSVADDKGNSPLEVLLKGLTERR